MAMPTKSSIDIKMSCIPSQKRNDIARFAWMLTYVAYRSILVLPVSKEIHPGHLESSELRFSTVC